MIMKEHFFMHNREILLLVQILDCDSQYKNCSEYYFSGNLMSNK